MYRKKFQDAKAKKTGGRQGSNAGAVIPTVFGAKQDDPLIMAETNKKVNERKGQIEMEYKASIDEIEHHFERRKKELIE